MGLKQAYREAGYEVLSGELADFLPLVLEFFSIAPEGLFQALWREYGLQVEKIAGALEQKGSPYGGIMRALYRMLEVKGGTQGPRQKLKTEH